MFGKATYKKLWCDEVKKKEESRGYIQRTHDSVIRTEEKVKGIKEDYARTNGRLDKHIEDEEAAFQGITDQLKVLGEADDQCPKKDAIDELVKAKEEQNGKLGRIEGSVKTILDRTEGKKQAYGTIATISIWVISITAGVSGGVVGGVKLLKWLEWIS